MPNSTVIKSMTEGKSLFKFFFTPAPNRLRGLGYILQFLQTILSKMMYIIIIVNNLIDA